MLKIRELIKKVRACKTAEEERSVINKEAAEIRNESKDLNNPHKARNLLKAIYMQMMGYQTSFMQLLCINLLASKNFTEKRIAYSALSLIMDENSKVLLLATATIKKDLTSDNDDFISLALNAVGDVCTPDMCRELSYEIVNIIKSKTDANIRKKAACAVIHIIKKCPELIETFIDCTHILIDDKTHSVCMNGIVLVLEIIKNDPNFYKKIAKYHTMFVKYEKALLSVSYSPEFDVNGITDPFLQARIIEILAYTAKGNKELSDELGDLFVSVQSITEASKQTGYAIQYEIVKAINKLEANPGMKSLSSTILGKFLSSKDLNLKYIALNTLKDVARTDIAAVQKHRALILEFLKETDISLQRRALDLIYIIINTNNIKQILKECLKFLPIADDSLKLEMTTKLTQSINLYAPSFKWEIDTLIKMIVLSSNCIYEDTLSTIINLIIKVKELAIYSVHKLFITLKNNTDNKSLAKVAVYVIGEFCDYLINNTILSGNDEEIKVTLNDVIQLFEQVSLVHKDEATVIEYLLNCVFKLSNKYPEKSNEFEKIIDKYEKSNFAEVQQRAIEYKVLDAFDNMDLRHKVVENIPIPKETNITEKDLVHEGEEKENDNVNGATVVKLKLLNNNSSNNNIQANTNINNNINLTQQYQQAPSSNVNLLDLENIFAGTASTQQAQPFAQQIPNVNMDMNMNMNFPLPQLNEQTQINNQQQQMPTSPGNLTDLLNLMNMPPQMMQSQPTQIPLPSPQTQPIITQPIQEQKEEQPQMKECFKNEDMSLYYVITKIDNLNYNGTIYASNNTAVPIENIKINFMVLKFVTLKVLKTSGNRLDPRQSLGIKKDFTLNSSDKDKKIVMKIKLAYQLNNKDITHMITLNDF